MNKVLITGGAGFIGSHTSLVFLEAGLDVVVLDNLCNSSVEAVNRVQKLAKRPLDFVRGDVRDGALLKEIFEHHNIDAVLHFAGLKAVGESSEKPLLYYENNVAGAITLANAMQRAQVFNVVFSSTATVYGDPTASPVPETHPTTHPTNPYAQSKLMVEKVLTDLAASDDRWKVALLRYFNPVGAHDSGEIGEDPQGIPNNLLPFITQVAVGRLKSLKIFGSDYPTRDGTGVRDYIHVMDLAEGHLAALVALQKRSGAHAWNLGTGMGFSVLEIVNAFEAACGKTIPHEFAPRRPGDVAEYFADPSKARVELNWKTKRSLADMMRDAWRWQSKNPNGYRLKADLDIPSFLKA